MTATKAANIQSDRMRGKADPNTVRRVEHAAKDADAGRWTVEQIWTAYKDAHPRSSQRQSKESLFSSHILPSPVSNKTPDELVTLDIERLRRDVSKAKHQRTGKPLSDQTVKHVALSCSNASCAGQPTLGISPNPPTLNSRCLPWTMNQPSMTPEQADAYFKALDEEIDQDAAAYFSFHVADGHPARALSWPCAGKMLTLDRAFLVLRGKAAKSGKTQSIPLSPRRWMC